MLFVSICLSCPTGSFDLDRVYVCTQQLFDPGIDISYGDARTIPNSSLMTLACEEKQEHDGDSGEASLRLSPSTNDSRLGSEDGGSEVGSGDGNLSSTPDSTFSQDNGTNGEVSMSARAGITEDGDGQVHPRRPSSPAATPDRPTRQSRTRGLKGLNGGLTPRRSGANELSEPAEAVDIDESVEIGLSAEEQSTQCSLKEKAPHEQQICVSFSKAGPIGLELTVSTHYRQQRQVAPVVVRAIRPGTQATAHVPPLRAGLVLICVGDADVSASDPRHSLALSNLQPCRLASGAWRMLQR